MTTVALKDGIIAADSRITSSLTGVFTDCFEKLEAWKDCVIAYCGELGEAQYIARWFKRGANPDKFSLNDPSGAYIVVASHLGVFVYNGPGCCVHIKDDVFACGSGGDAAKGAMLAGASAEEAVRIAMRVDNTTGGFVSTMAIPTKKGRTRGRR